MKEKGTIIIITFLAMGILIIFGVYFLSLTLSESKISKAQKIAAETYYLTESGINEAIWKLKNDETGADGDVPWKICFTTSSISDGCPDCKTWSSTFTRNYIPDSTTTVSINNSDCAAGEIVATSSITFSLGKNSQRVIKIKVIKTLGTLTENSPIFSGKPSGEINIISSEINVYDGNIFSNQNINIKNESNVSVYDNQFTGEQEGKVLSPSNINLDSNAFLYASGTCDNGNFFCEGYCEFPDDCPPDSSEMPAIDFDSPSIYSYRSKAQEAENQGQCKATGKYSDGSTVFEKNECIYSESEFKDLLWQVGLGGKLILEHKTNGSAISTYYVEGGIDLQGGRYLEINGVLIADGTINIGEKLKWGQDEGYSQLTINDPGVGIPSGLLTKAKMNFGNFSSFQDVNIVGLVYSQDEMQFIGSPHPFNATGGMIARKVSFTSCFSPFNLYLDNAVIREGVWGGPLPPPGGTMPYSPVITVEHWEESY